MRAGIAAAILGTVLVASPGSQTSGPRPSDSLERPFAQNGRIRMDLSAAEYVISGSHDNRIQVDLHAAPFNVIKGGLFRSFDWSGKGPYRLHAKLKAGDLRLYSKGSER